MSNDVDTLKERLEGLNEQVNKRVKAMSRKGIQVNPASIQQGRMEFFIQWSFENVGAEGEEGRLKFEIDWGEQVLQILERTERQANRERLLAGGHIPRIGDEVRRRDQNGGPK